MAPWRCINTNMMRNATIPASARGMTMPDNAILFPVLAALGLALATGPLGSFVVWRRMAYFGDATAHAAVLGVALAIGFSLPVYTGVFAVALAMALFITLLNRRGHSLDTGLGVLAYAGLALGLVAISFTDQPDLELHDFLFGDILAVTAADVAVIWGGALLVLAGLVWRWSALLTATLNPDLATASGLNPDREHLVLTLALAVVVAVAIKVVGALLIGAMLLIPAATARSLARSPEMMAVLAVLAGGLAGLAGLFAAFLRGIPAGPGIVVASAVLFAASTFFSREPGG
jgi:zinc transport system permease protein